MIKNLGNIRLNRFTAGKSAKSQLTAEKFNDIIDAIKAITLQSGTGYLLNRTPNGTTLTIKSAKNTSATKNPFSLYMRGSDEEYAYVSVRPALVNNIVPEMLNAYVEPTEGEEESTGSAEDAYTSIEDSPAPMLQVSATGRVEILLWIIIERDSTSDDFAISQCVITAAEAEADSDTKITHILKLGYVQDGVATSYHSTSLSAEICEEAVTVWAT